MSNIRILMIDNRELVCLGVRSMLEQEKDIEIVGTSVSPSEALFEIVRRHPDIVLVMDTYLKETNLEDTILNLKRGRPGSAVDVIIMTGSAENHPIAMKAGASGCLMHDVTQKEFTQVIRSVYKKSHPEEESKHTLEEITEVVISPPSSASVLLEFLCQLGNTLHHDFASIICTVGSWERGTIVTVKSHSMPSDLVIELANMELVDRIEEKSLEDNHLSGISRKFDFLHRLGASPTRRLLVTLKNRNDAETDIPRELIPL